MLQLQTFPFHVATVHAFLLQPACYLFLLQLLSFLNSFFRNRVFSPATSMKPDAPISIVPPPYTPGQPPRSVAPLSSTTDQKPNPHFQKPQPKEFDPFSYIKPGPLTFIKRNPSTTLVHHHPIQTATMMNSTSLMDPTPSFRPANPVPAKPPYVAPVQGGRRHQALFEL